MDVEMMPSPSRVSGVVALVLSAGFTGTALYFGNKSKTDRQDIETANSDPNLLTSDGDARYKKIRNNAIIADSLFLAGGIAGLSALYYLLRSPGPDSMAEVENKSLVENPEVSLMPVPLPSGGAVVGAWGF